MLIVATTETIAGHRIVRTLGYVEGHYVGLGYDEGPGGRYRYRGQIDDLRLNAERWGANAVVGMRWIGPTVRAAESVAYGTAVVIEPEAG